jgi:8-oxo-dGTP pyrophosphatase MutT (NUDIX family)
VTQVKQLATEDFKNRGIYITIPLIKGILATEIQKAGFELYALNREQETLTFLFRNGRAIPFLDTAFVTASIFITRMNKDGIQELLCINEYDKKDLTVPAGSIEAGELAIEGVMREVEEEIGIKLSPSDIKLYSIRNRTFKETGKNHVDFNYCVSVPYDTVVTVDEKEVLSYAWIPVAKIIDNTASAFDKVFSKLYADVIHSKISAPGVVTNVSPIHNVVKVRGMLD